MAIIKHIASKNADYGAAERYLLYKHDEFTNKPILDENGRMILRDEFLQTNIRGVFPSGEGAGYAGGIVSAAVDGVKCAEAVLADES